MRVTFWGAAGTVTGSRFLVDAAGGRVLVDCGMFQGVKAVRQRNWEPFPFEPSSVDAVVLTHAHLDHSGMLPALVRDGFAGPVWGTQGTADLCEILLRDAAHLQEEDARRANKYGTSKHHPALPLYTEADAEAALGRLGVRPWRERFEPVPGVEVGVELSPVGHILGASCVRVSDGSTSVLFTGDVGRPEDAVMLPPEPPPAADYVVTESTYGNRLHPPEDPAEELARVINRTLARRGTVLIPVFAVGRAQLVLYLLGGLRRLGKVPDVPVYLDSPMAIDATELFMRHRGDHRLDAEACRRMCDGVKFLRSAEDSMAVSGTGGPKIVLAASGMASGGRVLHHLETLAPDRRSSVVFVGFQAAGTRGEALLAGAQRIKMFGEYVPVRAEVRLIDGLSAHADAEELTAWLGHMPRPRRAFIVHGEPAAADTLRRTLRDDLSWNTHVPGHGESVELG